MFSGVFDFLLKRDHLDLWLRLGGLLGGTFLLYMLMALMARAGNLLGMVFFLGPPVIATILWTIYAGAWAMAVFRETAEGNDSIEAPEPLPVEWFNDSLYLIIPLIWSALGVVGIGLLFGPILPEGFPWHTVVIFLLWPVLILATAEEGAPWLPAGLGAWASLWNAGRYWLVFYAETVAMVAAAEVLSRIVASIGGVSAIAGLILLAALVPWMWLTYFRLLGRLAAVITHVQGQRLVDEES